VWREKNWRRWERSDGAVVQWDQRSPHVRPWLPAARMWTAWEPDPSDNYLKMTNGRLSWPRRFKTAQAAMRAVDKEFPA
jgi:hypothetical protein